MGVKLSDLDARLRAAAERKKSEPNHETVDVLVDDEVWTLKFTELDSKAWTDITATHPFRIGSLIDQNYGYNYHASCEAAAPVSGARVVDGEDVPLSKDTWELVFSLLSSPDRGLVTDAIWKLNEFEPAQRLAKAKKALLAAQKQKRP